MNANVALKIRELMDYADQQGTIYDTALDEEVHDTASEIASNVNNAGLERQLGYLLENNGISDEYIESIKQKLTEEE